MSALSVNSSETKKRALALLQTGRLEEARELSERICHATPNDPEAWFLLGAAYGQLGRFEEGITCCRRAIEYRPDYVDAYVVMASLFKAQKDLEAAVSCYRNALAILPQHPGVLNNLGNTLVDLGRLQEAEVTYRQALRANPRYAEAFNNLGTALKKQSKAEEAAESYRQALQLKPDYATAHNNLGNVLKDMGHLEDAIASYRRALQLNPGYAEAHNNLGTALRKTGNFEQAITSYRQALQIDPRNFRAYHNLGNIYQDMNRLEEAAEHYHKALRLMPDFVEAHVSMGSVLQKQGRGDEAIKCYREALRIKPDDSATRYLLAALGDEPPPLQAPLGYVQELFDEYSDHFDEHLTGDLGYRIPELIYRVVTDAILNKQDKFDVLDLGCGTGLCGPLFHDLAHSLVGVDLSPKMIARARARQVYSELLVGDVNAPPIAMGTMFDLILAADVFVYIGDLARVFHMCGSTLRPGGLFVFSTEAAGDETGTYALHEMGRYAHSPGYIRSMASSENFVEIKTDSVVLRREKDVPVLGHIYVFRKKKLSIPDTATIGNDIR